MKVERRKPSVNLMKYLIISKPAEVEKSLKRNERNVRK